VFLSSWVNAWVDARLARSTWGRFRPIVRIAWASVIWFLSVGVGVLALVFILGASNMLTVFLLGSMAAWLAVMLAGYVLHSRALLRAAVWGIGLVALLPLALAALGVR
jgi:hypothetical protein